MTLEALANALNAASIWLAARNSILTWPAGIAGCLLFGALFVGHQLYADATLQSFFIATSVIGWWRWGAAQRPVTRARPAALAAMALAGLVAAFGYGYLLHRFTDAYLPYADSLVLSLSVAAQCLLMQRKVETWPAWLLVNTISVGIFTSRGLHLTAILYAIFWLNAWYGWWGWRRALHRPMTVIEAA